MHQDVRAGTERGRSRQTAVRRRPGRVTTLAPSAPGRAAPLGSGNCFVAGTPVETPDGTRAIEELRVGDLVVSRDEQTGTVSAKPIVRTYVRLAPSVVDVRIADADGTEEVIRSTPEHRFWSLGRGWIEAGSLTEREPLLGVAGHELAVVSVTPFALEAVVYNFEVDVTHTYFVGSLPVLVHNPSYLDPPVYSYGNAHVQLDPVAEVAHVTANPQPRPPLPPEWIGDDAERWARRTNNAIQAAQDHAGNAAGRPQLAPGFRFGGGPAPVAGANGGDLPAPAPAPAPQPSGPVVIQLPDPSMFGSSPAPGWSPQPFAPGDGTPPPHFGVPLPPRPDLDTVMPVTGVHTNRKNEWPYHLPPRYERHDGENPFRPQRLDPSQTYLWVIDANGNFVVAPENQPGFHSDGGPRPVKHADLLPPGGKVRPPGRAGGELHAVPGTHPPEWQLDFNSSYSFDRLDGRMVDEDPAAAAAVEQLLQSQGTNTSTIWIAGHER